MTNVKWLNMAMVKHLLLNLFLLNVLHSFGKEAVNYMVHVFVNGSDMKKKLNVFYFHTLSIYVCTFTFNVIMR